MSSEPRGRIARAIAANVKFANTCSDIPTHELCVRVFRFANAVLERLAVVSEDDAELLEALSQLSFLLDDLAPVGSDWESCAHAFGDNVGMWVTRRAYELLLQGVAPPLSFLEWIEAETVPAPRPRSGGPVLDDIPLSEGSDIQPPTQWHDYGSQMRLVCAILDAAPPEKAQKAIDKYSNTEILEIGTAAATEIWRVSRTMSA